jgi:hypothetical protein
MRTTAITDELIEERRSLMDPCDISQGVPRPKAGAKLFPHLRSLDGNSGIRVETEFYFPAPDLEHDHLEHRLEAGGSADHD